jgi:hypothetical protein
MLNTLCGQVNAKDFFFGSTIQKTEWSAKNFDITCINETKGAEDLKYTRMNPNTYKDLLYEVEYHHHTYHANEPVDRKNTHFRSIIHFYNEFLRESTESLELRHDQYLYLVDSVDYLNQTRSKTLPTIHMEDIDVFREGPADKCMFTIHLSLVACSKEIIRNEGVHSSEFSTDLQNFVDEHMSDTSVSETHEFPDHVSLRDDDSQSGGRKNTQIPKKRDHKPTEMRHTPHERVDGYHAALNGLPKLNSIKSGKDFFNFLKQLIRLEAFETQITHEITLHAFGELEIIKILVKLYDDFHSPHLKTPICKNIVDCKTFADVIAIIGPLEDSIAYKTVQIKSGFFENIRHVDISSGKSVFKILKLILAIEKSTDLVKLHIVQYMIAMDETKQPKSLLQAGVHFLTFQKSKLQEANNAASKAFSEQQVEDNIKDRQGEGLNFLSSQWNKKGDQGSSSLKFESVAGKKAAGTKAKSELDKRAVAGIDYSKKIAADLAVTQKKAAEAAAELFATQERDAEAAAEQIAAKKATDLAASVAANLIASGKKAADLAVSEKKAADLATAQQAAAQKVADDEAAGIPPMQKYLESEKQMDSPPTKKFFTSMFQTTSPWEKVITECSTFGTQYKVSPESEKRSLKYDLFADGNKLKDFKKTLAKMTASDGEYGPNKDIKKPITAEFTHMLIKIIDEVEEYETLQKDKMPNIISRRHILSARLFKSAAGIFQWSDQNKTNDINHFMVMLSIIRTSVFGYETLFLSDKEIGLKEHKDLSNKNAEKFICKEGAASYKNNINDDTQKGMITLLKLYVLENSALESNTLKELLISKVKTRKVTRSNTLANSNNDKAEEVKAAAAKKAEEDKLAKDKLEKDKPAKDKLAKDKLEKDKLAKDKLEKDTLAKKKLEESEEEEEEESDEESDEESEEEEEEESEEEEEEKSGVGKNEAKKAEKKKAEKKKAEKEKAEKEKAEKEKAEKEKAGKKKAEKEKAEKDTDTKKAVRQRRSHSTQPQSTRILRSQKT